VADGTFREDLFFRLNVIPIHLSPLRERPDDIPALVAHFSALHRARTGRSMPVWRAGALRLFGSYRWPGNVRELANIVERLAILHAGRVVSAADVREVVPLGRDGGATPASGSVLGATPAGGTSAVASDGHQPGDGMLPPA
jgi:two-component system nitrogen regulation response regulator NtrX